jgi:periplasmic protein CpxP/Spy
MKQHLIKFATVAALAAGMAMAQTPAAPANPATPRAGRAWAARRGAVRQRMMQALNLSDAQKAQAKTIFQQARQNAQPLAQQLKQNRESLTAAVKANDVAQIHSLAAQQGNLRGQMLGIRSEAMAKFYTVLTPEQKAKADQMHQSMKTRMHQRNGNNG